MSRANNKQNTDWKSTLIALGIGVAGYAVNSLINTPKKHKLYSVFFKETSEQNFYSAFRILEQLQLLSPEDPIIYMHKGTVCLHLKQYYEAIKNSKKAFDLANNPLKIVMYKQMLKSICLNNIGVALAELGEDKKSEKQLELAHIEDKRNPYPLLGLARLSARGKNKEKTLIFLEKAIRVMHPPMMYTPIMIEVITHKDFEEYREFLLITALNNRIITPDIYQKYQKILMEKYDKQAIYNINEARIGVANFNSSNFGVQTGFEQDFPLSE